MCKELNSYLSQIKPLDQKAMEMARKRWSQVAKPLNSLGILEDNVVKLAGIAGTSRVEIKKRALLIFCSDNGIVEEGVTQTGKEVTAVVTENMTRGNSSVCLMARRAAVDVFPVDIGVSRDLNPGFLHPLLNRKIAYGTKNFKKEPAMTRQQALQAIETGILLVKNLSESGYNLIATGEMGIGNTTTSSAVSSILLKEVLDNAPKQLTGRGAGLDGEGLQRKLELVKWAVKEYGPVCKDPADVLAKAGGFDLAGLAGVFLGGAIYRIPVLLDGVISAAAALAAKGICPACNDYMLASHASAEPAGEILLKHLGLSPVIRAGMCLGEGTGAVAAVPLFDMALDIYTQMSSFEEIHIEEYKPLGEKL